MYFVRPQLQITTHKEFKLRREPLFLSRSLLGSANEPTSTGALRLVLLQ